MKFIAIFAVFAALIVPTAPASAMTTSETVEILQVLKAELEIIKTKFALATNNDGAGNVAGATYPAAGLSTFANGDAQLQLTSVTSRSTATNLCYIYATDYLINGDAYTCEFNGTLIFDSVVDANITE